MPKDKTPFYLRNEALYLLVWAIVFLVPLLAAGYGEQIPAHQWMRGWWRLLPYLLIFLINQYALAPRFLLRMQVGRYLLWLTTVIAAVHIADLLLHPLIEQALNIPLMPRRFARRPPPFLLLFLSHILISYLVAGLGSAVLLFRKWVELLQSSLDSLRHQISPHFFMNTLNNIHALIPQNPQSAQEACRRLSRMMRHTLYETQSGWATLRQEFDFIRNYYDLMRLRLHAQVSSTLELPEEPCPEGKLPALLLITFVENAFKHGVSYEKPSWIHIRISLERGWLTFECLNSAHPKTSRQPERAGGIGLSNVRRRLELLYPHHHELILQETPEQFRVLLRIPYETKMPGRGR